MEAEEAVFDEPRIAGESVERPRRGSRLMERRESVDRKSKASRHDLGLGMTLLYHPVSAAKSIPTPSSPKPISTALSVRP